MSVHPMTRLLPVTTMLALLAAPAARADNLEKKLHEQAPKLMKYLEEHRAYTVGVLKFRVQKGKQLPSFNVGLLNSSLAERLTNVLIMNTSSERPLTILRDVNQTAARQKLPPYTRPQGLQSLFAEEFPVAWGSQKARADLFLTGLVSIQDDMKKATVHLEAYTRKSIKEKPVEVLSFDVATDRTLLTDLGQSFLIPRSVGKRPFVRLEDLDQSGADSAADLDQNSKNKNPLSLADNLLDLEVFYNNTRQNIVPNPDQPGELQLDNRARPGDDVKFVIRNKGQENIGVVLMVNGVSTLFREKVEPINCTRWILGPGEKQEIKGFYNDDQKTYQPFRVLTDEEQAAIQWWDMDHPGLIQAHVFVSASVPPPEPYQITRQFVRGATLQDLQKQLRNGGSRKIRNLIWEDTSKTGQGELTYFKFENPQPIGSIAIRYEKAP